VRTSTSKSLFNKSLAILAGCALLGGALPALAQDECAVPDCSGVALNFNYAGDLRDNTTGGIKTGTAYSQMLTLGLDWSSDSLFSDARVTGSAAVMYMGGDHISGDYVGDLQGLNNIEADTGWILYEAWTEFAFGGKTNTTLRTGVLDLNAEFDAPETLGLFVGPPHGIGTEFSQTGSAGPSIWPLTGLGIRAAGGFENGLTWRFGVYDGAPGSADGTAFANLHVSSDEGALLIGELAYSSERINKISFGAWNYTARFDRIDAELLANPTPENGNQGFYALIDLSLGEIGDTAFDGALRVGNAKAQFNPVDNYVGAALTASNFWAGRPDDAIGIAVAYAHLGDEYRATQAFNGAPTTSSEVSYELAYSTSIGDWLAIKPGVQFVQHPGADASLRNSWIVGLRFEISRGKSWRLAAQRESGDGGTVASLDH
jgi:porin